MKHWIRLTFVLAIVGSLSGCGAALVGGGAAGGYYTAEHKTEIKRYTKDSVITSKIRAKYLKDMRLKSFHVSVSTHRGNVTLTGTVPSHKMRDRAIKVAASTKGVKNVNAAKLNISPK